MKQQERTKAPIFTIHLTTLSRMRSALTAYSIRLADLCVRPHISPSEPYDTSA